VKITIVKPPVREAVGVGGGAPEAPDGEASEGAADDADESSAADLPAEPEVLPDVPDARPPP